MASTVAESERLSLPFEPQHDGKTLSLQSQVQRIISAKGAFRNVSELNLRAQIDESTNAQPDDLGGSENGDQDQVESNAKRQERLWNSRDDMLQKLDYVQNEVLSALDFVSLLLSGQSAAAQASMSPALKQMAPSGSMEPRNLKDRPTDRATIRRFEEVSQGWKSDGFRLAAQKLELGASRLEAEARRQSSYWKQIAMLKSHNWPVSRLPSDSRAIVVHYGFSEAAVQFRNRGISILRQNESGDLELDERSIPTAPKHTMVKILRHGQDTGSFTAGLIEAGGSSEQILSKIIVARNSLFQEELFYEINREARLIANQGVITRSGVVEITITEGFQIHISQTSRGSTTTKAHSSDQSLAEMVATTLQLLLTSEHQKSYRRRSMEAPPPMATADRRIAEYALLRPLIARARHHTILSTTTSILREYQEPLLRAGLTFVVSMEDSSYATAAALEISELNKPTTSKIKLVLPSKKSVEVSLETYLGSPIYGCQFLISSTEYRTGTVTTAPLRIVQEFASFFQHLLTVDIVNSASEMEESGPGWLVTRPHSGEMELVRSSNRIATLQVKCQSRRLALRLQRNNQSTGDVFVWTADSTWSKVQGIEKDHGDETFAGAIAGSIS